MSRRALLTAGLLLSALGQAFLLADLIGERVWIGSTPAWLSLHVVVSVVSAGCTSRLLGIADGSKAFYLCLLGFTLLIPVAGTLGSFAAFFHADRQARQRCREPDFWTFTAGTSLPYTTPSGRQVTPVDSRGFTEQVSYADDVDDLYRKVLAAGNMRSSLSVGVLKQALRHGDERIRLTAFKILDRKVTELNQQIQRLEAQVAAVAGDERSNAWLQIASNYWELLTLEEAEPIARQQLLDKASTAAIQAVAALPINRNAHFLLGRVSLLQGDTRRANVAFTRAQALGMPADKVVPYLAETAFMRHDFQRVRNLLRQLDPAIRAYPPLSQVVEYWA